MQQAIRYMEEHMLDEVTYEDVARSVRMSGYNFHRMFSFITGMTAGEYLRCRRLTLAAQELQTTGASVIEVAYKYGYESPESFSKAFSRFHGSTPSQARRKGARLRLFNPLAIKITLEGGHIMDYRIEHRECQRFVALVRDFPNEIVNDESNHSIPDFWTECADKGLLDQLRQLRPEGQRNLYGLCNPCRDSDTHFQYGIGVLADEATDRDALDTLPGGEYILWETGPADYAVFKCYGADGDCLGETWSKFFKEFSPQTGYVQTDDPDYEIYFEQGEPGLFCELWVPVKLG